VVIGVLPVSVVGFTWGEAVVGLSTVGWSISFDEAAEVIGVDPFFYVVLKRLAFVCCVVVISVVLAVFGHICIHGIQGFTWWWDEVRMECFIEKP